MADVQTNGMGGFNQEDLGKPITTNGQSLAGQALTNSYSNDDSTLAQSEYDFTYKVFPADLGMDYLGHYMVININVPVVPQTSDGPATPRGSALTTSQFKLLDDYSKVDVLRYGNLGVSDTPRVGFFNVPRRTRRIAQSIALYMPGAQLVFNHTNDYQNVSMTSLGGGIISGAASWAAGAVGMLASGKFDAGPEIANKTGTIIDGMGKAVMTTAGIAGYPINPCVEVIFSTTNLREFTFDFLFVPRNEKESEIIKEIIKTLRFYAAPEIDRGGYTFIPPAEFDLTFFHRGVENTHIPRINTCVLMAIEADYSSATNDLWVSFRNGHPLATRVRMMFREVEVVHKLRVLQGF